MTAPLRNLVLVAILALLGGQALANSDKPDRIDPDQLADGLPLAETDSRITALAFAEEASRQLARREDARSLYVAALFEQRAMFQRASAGGGLNVVADGRLARRALALTDEPAILYGLAVNRQLGLDDRERMAALQRLRLIDPGNLLPLLLLETDSDDGAVLAGRLQNLPNGLRRADMYFDAVGPMALDVFNQGGIAPDLLRAYREHVERETPEAGELETSVMVAAEIALNSIAWMPAMQPLTRQCSPRGERWQDSMRDACLMIAILMARESDTAILQSLGFSLWHQLVAGTEAEAEVAGLRRDAAWRHAAWGHLEARRSVAEQLADLVSGRDTEIERITAALRVAGVPLQAPASWEPDNPARLELR